MVSGQSTFMVEMNEVAQILKYATADSLIILDEVGRGTSTFDGMSIARSVVEHIEKKIGAKTLFATHYHELTDMEDGKIRNFCVAVKERGGDVVFLRRIVQGSADKSYGIHVAKLAGLPKNVIKRAEEILQEYVQSAATPTLPKTGVETEVANSIFVEEIEKHLLALDIMSLTPLEAMSELFRLQETAKKAGGMG